MQIWERVVSRESLRSRWTLLLMLLVLAFMAESLLRDIFVFWN